MRQQFHMSTATTSFSQSKSVMNVSARACQSPLCESLLCHRYAPGALHEARPSALATETQLSVSCEVCPAFAAHTGHTWTPWGSDHRPAPPASSSPTSLADYSAIPAASKQRSTPRPRTSPLQSQIGGFDGFRTKARGASRANTPATRAYRRDHSDSMKLNMAYIRVIFARNNADIGRKT